MPEIYLPNNTFQGIAPFASFLSAGLLITVPVIAVPSAKLVLRHLGQNGFWYATTNRTSGPTSTNFSYIIAPNEAPSENFIEIGPIWLLADGNVDGGLSWYVSWTTR